MLLSSNHLVHVGDMVSKRRNHGKKKKKTSPKTPNTTETTDKRDK